MRQAPEPAYKLQQFPLVDVLRLIRTTNVGSITFFKLLRQYGTPKKALDALPELSKRGGRKKPLVAFSKSEAEKEIAKVEKLGARMVVFGEPDYPSWLTTINDPPPLLTMLGSSEHWNGKPCIAMVGARNASASGCAFAKRLATQLGQRDITIVSGLARGIDTFAHQGSLATGTVGVIASGIDVMYPPENSDLFAQLAEDGAIISEQPFGQAPFNTSFPSRNRIIAGMSLGTIVVEAALKSGSLITAKNALDYNRDVFAVPGSPMDPRAKGCNQLLKDGAVMCEHADDIIRTLNSGIGGGMGGDQTSLCETSNDNYDAMAMAPDAAELESARSSISEKLGYQAVGVDELVLQCHVSASACLTILLEFELAGRLLRHPGNQVSLSPEAEVEFVE